MVKAPKDDILQMLIKEFSDLQPKLWKSLETLREAVVEAEGKPNDPKALKAKSTAHNLAHGYSKRTQELKRQIAERETMLRRRR